MSTPRHGKVPLPLRLKGPCPGVWQQGSLLHGSVTSPVSDPCDFRLAGTWECPGLGQSLWNVLEDEGETWRLPLVGSTTNTMTQVSAANPKRGHLVTSQRRLPRRACMALRNCGTCLAFHTELHGFITDFAPAWVSALRPPSTNSRSEHTWRWAVQHPSSARGRRGPGTSPWGVPGVPGSFPPGRRGCAAPGVLSSHDGVLRRARRSEQKQDAFPAGIPPSRLPRDHSKGTACL